MFCGGFELKIDEFVGLMDGKRAQRERQEGEKIRRIEGGFSLFWGGALLISFSIAFTVLKCGLLFSSVA